MSSHDRHQPLLDPFQERLLTELRAHVAERAARGAPEPPRPRRGHRRRTRLALAGGVAAVAIGTAIVVTGGDGAPAAFAVESQDDGSVSVEIRGPGDGEKLERALADVGVPADVTYLPANQTCDRGRFTPATSDVPAGREMTGGTVSGALAQGGDGATTFTIAPGQVGQGETLVIVISRSDTPGDGSSSTVSMATAAGDVGPCEPVTALAPSPDPSAVGAGGVRQAPEPADGGPSFDQQGG
jgi:hypothetical protein